MEAFPPRAVVFDLDGVILDSFAANIAYYNYIAAQMGLGVMASHDEEIVHRETHEQALIHLAGKDRLAEAHAWGRDYNAKQLQKTLKLFDGVAETLSFLKNKVPLAVGSNRASSALELLDRLGILGEFKLVVTPLEAPAPKPSQAFMRYLLEQLGLTPQEVIYVGDSLVDEQLCHNSHVRLLAFQNHKLNAWAHAHNFKDIPAILGFV